MPKDNLINTPKFETEYQVHSLKKNSEILPYFPGVTLGRPLKACDIFKKRHLPCYAHTLNLIMQDMLGLECIKKILTKCKEIVRFFKSSTVGTELLKKEQRATKTPEYKLIQQVPTRWNSSYYMVKRILEIVDALNQALIKLRNAPPPLTVDETIVLEDLEKIWSPFEEATKKISGFLIKKRTFQGMKLEKAGVEGMAKVSYGA